MARGLGRAGRLGIGAMALVLAGCTTSSPGASPQQDDVPAASGDATAPTTPSPSPGLSGSASAGPTTPSPSPSQTEAEPPHPVSLPALFEKDYNGGALRVGRVILETERYTEYHASYRSEKLRISARLAVPKGRGPHPALVLAHGYIEPSYYVNGQGLTRERGWLADAGYIVLHTDYRNHAESSNDPRSEREMRLGYTVDTINAVHALRGTRRLRVDDDRIGLLGRSMGGGVVYNALVSQPGLVGAGVVFAPVSSRAIQNFNRWTRGDSDPGDSSTARFVLRRYGDRAENPRFWRELSARTYFDRITEPVLIHHGTFDSTCPLRWSRATAQAMREAAVDVRLRLYPGEEHAFGPQFPQSMRRTIAFFDSELSGAHDAMAS